MFLYAMVLATGMSFQQLISYPLLFQGTCGEQRCEMYYDGLDIVYVVYFTVTPWGKKPLEIIQVLKDDPHAQAVIFLDKSVVS